ncbi:MAG: hypothetical protein MN733_33280 [Nitrososphaera sp.]|nr:hypothetical protein [Nitrososphaera sp.]
MSTLDLTGKALFDGLIEVLESIEDEEFDQNSFDTDDGYGCGCICWHARRAGIVSPEFEGFSDVFQDLGARLYADYFQMEFLLSISEIVQLQAKYLGLPEETSFRREDAIRRLRTIREAVYPPVVVDRLSI